ncbi:MAG: hypothetical protein JW883_00540 [Deltaproteobacteria bacterium]|nr:hypothetical protein [Deltaproteobacteria bacterium]
MRKRSKLLLASLAASFLIFSIYATAYPQQRRLYLNFKKQRLSANIKNTPLGAVLDKIKDKKDIWFETGFMRDSSLLDNDISVQFRNLPIQDGLERILSGINHSLMFKGNSVVGVMLLGRPGKRTYRGRGQTTRPRRTTRGRASRRR